MVVVEVVSDTVNRLFEILLKREFWIRMQWISLFASAFCVSWSLLIAFFPNFMPEAVSKDSKYYVGLFAILSLGFLFFVFFISVMLIKIRSSSEKINQELSSKFSDEQAEILLKIVKEKDEDVKKKLRRQAFILRQEYELLLGENLQDKDGNFFTDWRKVLLATRKRLQDEENRLKVRNVANMQSGIRLAFFGTFFPLMYFLYVIYGFVFNVGNKIELPLTTYLPIVSIVLIFEVIAFFFLNLYASNERRLERNKSDLTNIELRLTAGLMLRDKTNVAQFAVLAKIIAQEDSKFVLGKNETTGGISTNKLLETLLKTAPTGGG